MAKATETTDAPAGTRRFAPGTAGKSVRIQHPALDGDVQGEIDHRTADPTGTPGRFARTFHLGGLGWARPDHPVHAQNAAEVVGDAMRRGLHPKGNVHLVDAVEHDEPRSQRTVLTYEVDVVPAIVDEDVNTTSTPHDATLAATAGHKPAKGKS
jgi:hypothetical protein